MARKPNYKFDRMERERAKAAKKAARSKAKAEKAEAKKAGLDGSSLGEPASDDLPPVETASAEAALVQAAAAEG